MDLPCFDTDLLDTGWPFFHRALPLVADFDLYHETANLSSYDVDFFDRASPTREPLTLNLNLQRISIVSNLILLSSPGSASDPDR